MANGQFYYNWKKLILVFGEVVGNWIYYQVVWYSGNLTCSLNGTDFERYSGRSSTYYNGYAQCSPIPLGYHDVNITLNLDGKTYLTNEKTSLSNGRFPTSTLSKYIFYKKNLCP